MKLIDFKSNQASSKVNFLNKRTHTQPAFCSNLKTDVFEKSLHIKKVVDFGTVYLKKNNFYHPDKSPSLYILDFLQYKKPLDLNSAIESIIQLKKKEDNKIPNWGYYTTTKTYSKLLNLDVSILKTNKITRFLGSGTSAMCFELENGKVLKLTMTNHFPMERGIEDFDAPVFEKGVSNNIHYYVQEKCDVSKIDHKDIEEIKKRILKKGYLYHDLDETQVGYAKNGNLYLIDPECAYKL